VRDFSCAHTSNAIAHLQIDSCFGVIAKILVVVVASVWGECGAAFEAIERMNKQ
jgi:hypothetical protein